MSGLTLSSIMRREREVYLDMMGIKGGSAKGFRDWIARRHSEDPRLFPIDALRDEAANKGWQSPPRERGHDLFSLGGVPIPEFLTRSQSGFPEGDDIDETTDGFEKVSARFATVNDRFEDALIKMRKAAQSSAKAEKDMQQADEARRRARGDMSAFLKDIAD